MNNFTFRITFIFIYVAFKGFSQTAIWTKAETGDNIMGLTQNRISTCANGETYVIASFSSQVAVGSNTLTDNGYEAGYFSKYSSAGSVLWTKKISSSNFVYAHSLSSDEQNNVYVTGRYYNDASFGSLTLTVTGSSGAIFVSRHDPNGNVVWAKSFPSSGNFLIPQSIKNDSLKNIYLTGWFQGPITFGSISLNAAAINFFIVKLDSLGNVKWANSYGGATLTDANDLAVDKFLNVYVTGEFGDINATGNQDLVIGSTTLTTGDRDIFLAKFDPNGNPVFAKKAGGSAKNDFGIALCYDGNARVYLTGAFETTAQFDTHTITTGTLTNFNTYLACYDLSGNCSWVTKPASPVASGGFDVHVLSVKTIYVAGLTNNVLLLKFDSTGNELAAFTANASGANSACLSSDNNNALYLTSIFQGTLLTSDGLVNSGSSSVSGNFVMKLDANFTGFTDLTAKKIPSFDLYPNPANSIVNLACEQNCEGYAGIEIFDTAGQLVLKSEIRKELDISGLVSGLYLIRLLDSNDRYTLIKLIRE
jgi:hypothetical protein